MITLHFCSFNNAFYYKKNTPANEERIQGLVITFYIP